MVVETELKNEELKNIEKEKENQNQNQKTSGMIVVPKEEFEDLLNSAAERGAERVLAHLGLENGHAARDIRELRDLLEAWRDARHTALQTIIRVATTGLLAAIVLGAAIKFKQP
jgi:flagellar motor switch protein FliG